MKEELIEGYRKVKDKMVEIFDAYFAEKTDSGNVCSLSMLAGQRAWILDKRRPFRLSFGTVSYSEGGKKVGWLKMVAVVVCAYLLAGVSFAQPKEVPRKDIEEMIKKGVEWLKKAQAPDGSWDFLDKPFSCGVHASGKGLGEGCTAFCTFALLKAGVSRKDPAVQKGLQNAISRISKGNGEFCHCYCVACLILLLEAYYVEDEPPKKKEEKKRKEWVTELVKKKEDEGVKLRRRASPAHIALLKDMVKWLVEKQEPEKLVWRYPKGSGDIVDASNTQYVMLALAAAQRMRIPVPASCYLKVVQYFLQKQEKEGPEVEWFPVPAADHDFKDLKKIEKELVKDLRKVVKKFEKLEKKDPEGVPPREKWGTTVVDKAREKLFGGEKHKMFARGWAYMPDDSMNRAWCKAITGSMTTSGCVSLIIAKFALEEMGRLDRRLKERINKGIRDGAAWLAHMWRTDRNPSESVGACHLHYYLYGVERVGVLGLIPRFGDHYWYEEGVEFFKRTQKPDGSWDAGDLGTGGPVPDTAWALLFLCRATTPLVQIPQQEYSGEDVLGPSRKKSK